MLHRKAKSFVFPNLDDDCDKENKALDTPKKSFIPSIIAPENSLPLYEAQRMSMKRAQKASFTPNPLTRHKITPNQRGKLLEWLIEVSCVYTSKLAYFSSAKMMDQVYLGYPSKLNPDQTHLLGAVCLYISSKFHDIKPLKLSNLHSKVLSYKFTIENILAAERNVLEILEFQVQPLTSYNFIWFFSEELHMEPILTHICELICYFISVCYETLQFTEEEIALGCIFYCSRAMKCENIVRKVMTLSEIDRIYEAVRTISGFIMRINPSTIDLARISTYIKARLTRGTKSGLLFKFSDPKLQKAQEDLQNSSKKYIIFKIPSK